MDKRPLKITPLNVIDSSEVDTELIHRNLEANGNGVLALYNYLLEKGIIKVA